MNIRSRYLKISIIALLSVIQSVSCAFSSNYFPIKLGENETALKIISDRKNSQYFVTDKKIYKRTKNEFVPIIIANSKINDAIIDSNTLYLATDEGLYFSNLINYKLTEEKGLIFKFKEHKVNRLALDASGNLWIGTYGSGVYLKSGNSFASKLEISPVLSLAATKNGDVWVGTNVGMYRWRQKENMWNRYAEEGYSGYELPDNIVENLFSDAQSNMWVLMPDIVSFVSVNNTDGHIPAFNYVGKPNNQVLDIVDLGKSSYLFATTDGLVYLPGAPEDHHHDEGSKEVHTESKGPVAMLVSTSKLDFPSDLENEKVQKMFVDNGKIWFVTSKGILNIKLKQLKGKVKSFQPSVKEKV